MKKNKKAGNAMLSSISDLLIAGDERIELPPKVLETPIIPFDQSPIYKIKHFPKCLILNLTVLSEFHTNRKCKLPILQSNHPNL